MILKAVDSPFAISFLFYGVCVHGSIAARIEPFHGLCPAEAIDMPSAATS